MLHPPIAFIGGGNMARAIISGACEAGVLNAARVVVAEPDAARRDVFANAVASAGDAIRWLRAHEDDPCAGQIMLCVKPQVLGAVADELRPLLEGEPGERVIGSILAGVNSGAIARALALARGRIVRVMPNTPAQIGRGMTALALSKEASETDAALIEQVFAGIGEVIRIDESMMDAFTGVAGSGPAYLFYLAEAMTEAARRVGFDQQQAELIVIQTIAGSSELLAQSESSAKSLRKAVTSPGGTTAAATGVLDDGRLTDLFVRAIEAARDRGRELGGA